MGGSSPFNPNSPQAQAIADLFAWNLIISGIIFALVFGLTIYITIRYRSQPGAGEPAQVFGHTRLEIAWTLAPAVLLVVVFGFTIGTMRAADPPIGDRQPDMVITGYQWWWHVEYPASGVVTANEIHIPVGRRLLARIEGGDVIHDFWVPQLGPKRDMVPGHSNHIWIEADTAGAYLGACAEYCGNQHAWMRLRVIAQPQAEFDAWQQQQRQAAAAPGGGDAAQGALIFQQRTCANCHAIAGTPAAARAGPDLSHFAGRQTLGAGVLDNTPENLLKWLTDPQAIKPGNHMPSLRMAEAELRALVAYLETLQ
jgi:cytochrome c oxidase subunit II